ncbi:MAG: hypothetical protein HYY17_15545 [Planctomycetes bacterium]|nr:hypothetical protein [Planctomycetota bacterium]
MRVFVVAFLVSLAQDEALRQLEADVSKQKSDPVGALRAIAQRNLGEKAAPLARRTLFDGIDASIRAGLTAFAEERLDVAELHIRRACVLIRPYCKELSDLLARILLSMRTRARLEIRSLFARHSPERVAAARKSGLLAMTWSKELGELETAAREWAKSPPKQEAIDAERDRWLSRVGTKGEPCTKCGGIGESGCDGCRDGVIAQQCVICSGAARLTCAACDGKKRGDHQGYVGKLQLDIQKQIREPVIVKGRRMEKVLQPQWLDWTLSACDGKGLTQCEAQSKPKDGSPGNRETKTIACRSLWKELQNFVFNGKATISVPDGKGKMRTLLPAEARRFFGDYGECDNGKVSCNACARAGFVPCTACGGRGARLLSCSVCAGTASRICATCGFAGDATWIMKLVPEPQGPGGKLSRYAEALGAWFEERERLSAIRATLLGQMEAVRPTLDPAAKLTESGVHLPCKCKGSSSCELCWGSGHREFPEGSAEFEKYRSADRLARQFARVEAEWRRAPPTLALKAEDTVDPQEKPPERTRPNSTFAKTVRERLDEAKAQYEKGVASLRKAQESADAETRARECREALGSLRQAQELYAGAQEECRTRGIDVPQDVMESYRRTLQALVIARKLSP